MHTNNLVYTLQAVKPPGRKEGTETGQQAGPPTEGLESPYFSTIIKSLLTSALKLQ